MLQNVLVPLDGSELAEQALPMGTHIARRAGARVVLLHVLENAPPVRVHGERHLATLDEASAYLQHVAGELRDLQVSWHVHEVPMQDTAAGLGGHAAEFGCDLIVMCTHGQVRLRDRLVGNLGQQLAKRQHAPILLLPAHEGQMPPTTVRLCLAPLDGEAAHERGLGVAAELVKLFGGRMLLATVTNPEDAARKGLATSVLLPGTMQRLLECSQEQAVGYLQGRVEALAQQGVPAQAVVIPGGEPGRQLVTLARQREADMVMLTTHGRAGTEAFWSRSLPPRLLRRLRTMFLLVPAEQ